MKYIRDDGIVYFENKWSNREIQEWLESFQWKVNRVCGLAEITFTCEIWRNPDESQTGTENILMDNVFKKRIQVIKSIGFLFLDMKLK